MVGAASRASVKRVLRFPGLGVIGPELARWKAAGPGPPGRPSGRHALETQGALLGRGPVPAARLPPAACRLLAERRAKGAWDQPLGLLTHHLDHDEPAWRFLEAFLPVANPVVRPRRDKPAIGEASDQVALKTG
jgi:hypothetical protein